MNRGLPLRYLLFLCLTLCALPRAVAQLLPANQTEQDACNALPICGNFTTPYSYQGIGLINDLPSSPCAAWFSPCGEENSVWLKITVNSPGIIVFSINPINPADDYDFSVIDITNSSCSTFTNADVIRCNYNANAPVTNNGILGLNTTSTTQYVIGGTAGQSYCQQINANTGDVYLLMINNFSAGGTSAGFTLDFAGSTAGFMAPPPSQFGQILPYCDLSQTITIQLTDNVLCNSIAANGSDFYLSPGGTVASAVGLNCTGSNGYTNKVKLTFASPLPNGNYEVHAQVGTDGNTLLNFCDVPLETPDALNFHVGLDPIAFVSIDSPACQVLRINLNTPAACNSIAPNGSDFQVTGPSVVSIASATGTGCTPGGFTSTVELTLSQPIAVDGLYKVRSLVGSDGNTVIDSCTRILPPQSEIPFRVNSFNGLLQAGPDSIICNIGQAVTLYAHNAGPVPSTGFAYQWTPSTGIQNPMAAPTTLIVPNMRNVYVLATVDAHGCYLRDSLTLDVHPFNGELKPLVTSVCEDDPLLLQASGGTNYKWYDNPALTSVPVNTLDCINCPNVYATPPVGTTNYYVLITDSKGCKDTLKTEVTVNPLPIIESFPADTTIKIGKTVQLNAFGGTFYTWSPARTLNDDYSASPVASPQQTTEYIVTGANEYGCLGSDTSIVRIDFRDVILIPNAFSPNGDGLNDVFRIENFKFQKLLEFRIFDRWGNQVFETTNPSKGWDGTYNGKAAGQDVYYYLIRLGYGDDLVETFKGDITLIR